MRTKRSIQSKRKWTVKDHGDKWEFWEFRKKDKSPGVCIGCGKLINTKVDICEECCVIYTKAFYNDIQKLDRIL